jgi:cytochrome P450
MAFSHYWRDRIRLLALRSDPSLIPQAVEEFLRFDGPLMMSTNRFTIEPVRVGEVEIPAGQLVLNGILSANRDSAVFPEPYRLDIGRETNPHLTFGHRIHHCLGAPLARLEGEIAFTRLLTRYRSLTLAVDPAELTYRGSTLMHGLQGLPVHLRS